MTTDDMQAALDTYDQMMEVCGEHIMKLNYQLAASIRKVLLPILHRWGVGMLAGGTLVYQQPSIKAMGEGRWEVHEGNNDYALQVLHPQVRDALWKRATIYPRDPHPTMHDFITAIPLPGVDTEYIWITEDEDGHWDTVTFEDSLNEPLIDLLYCGPVTQAYWEDVKAHEGETVGGFVDVLPAYKYADGDFIRYYPWNQEL